MTKVVQSLVKDNAVSTKVDEKVFGDPAYGVVKTLNVQYTVDGKSKTVAVVEGKTSGSTAQAGAIWKNGECATSGLCIKRAP